MPTEDAYSSGHLVLSFSGLAFVLLVETSDALYQWDIILVCDNITVLDILLNLKFHQILVSIEHLQRLCHADRGAYSSGHLVLSHFGTCMCSNVETNLSWTCLVSGLLNFEHPSLLLFCFISQNKVSTLSISFHHLIFGEFRFYVVKKKSTTIYYFFF